MEAAYRPTRWVLFAVVFLAGGALGAPAHAQELPSRVTSELVEEALEQPIEATGGAEDASGPAVSRRPSRPPGATFASVIAWFTLVVAVAVLVSAWLGERARDQEPESGSLSTMGDPPDDAESSPGPALAGASTDPPSPEGTPREVLAIPPHVAAVLRRAERRRRATATSDDGSAEGPPAEGGLDYLVPGFDPWKGR